MVSLHEDLHCRKQRNSNTITKDTFLDESDQYLLNRDTIKMSGTLHDWNPNFQTNNIALGNIRVSQSSATSKTLGLASDELAEVDSNYKSPSMQDSNGRNIYSPQGTLYQYAPEQIKTREDNNNNLHYILNQYKSQNQKIPSRIERLPLTKLSIEISKDSQRSAQAQTGSNKAGGLSSTEIIKKYMVSKD